MSRKKVENPSDPRSEALKNIDKIIDSASEGLAPEDAADDPTVVAARAVRRLIEASWSDTRLPEWKVRVFWDSSDAIVRAVGPSEARHVALSVLPKPTANRVLVMRENLDRSWEEIATYEGAL